MSAEPHTSARPPGHEAPEARATGLVRRLGLFDATMIVMGGIVGSGIFINPYVVAQQVHTPAMILGAWTLGGIIALAGAFIYAELAALYPLAGGQYTYLRAAYHPGVAFVYGWALLLVTQTGGMAAVAVTFAHYFVELTRLPLSDGVLAGLALGSLTIINCLGVKQGSAVQSVLMVLKILAIAALVLLGWLLVKGPHIAVHPLLDRPPSLSLVVAMGAAMTPVLFAYGGWQTSCFVAGEVVEPEKNMPRGLVMGVLGVIAFYLSVNWVYVRDLGPQGLASSATPASAVMRVAWGDKGAELIAAGIVISTLGFLSQSILTAPRVYFAMARDGVFFSGVAWLHPRTHVPVVAIVLQGIGATVIALSGRYEQILNYVVSTDFIFFGLTATCLFVFRRREHGKSGTSATTGPPPPHRIPRMPGHPVSTGLFVAACWLVVLSTISKYPLNSALGLAILLAGVPVYFIWGRGRTVTSDK